MDCPGEYLKRERELRDISLDDISKEIKVPVKLLRALEADDYPSMPHTAFVKGFIRAYCKYLGLDENDALLRYELYLREVAEFEKPVQKPKQMDVRERLFPVRRFITLSLVVLGVIIIVGIYFLRSSPDDIEILSSPPREESSIEGVAKAPKGVQGDQKREVPEELEKEALLAPMKPAETANKQVALAPVATAPVAPTPVARVKTLKRAELVPLKTGPGEHLLRVHAIELTWMKLTIDSGEPFEVLMQPEETLQWKGKVFFYS